MKYNVKGDPLKCYEAGFDGFEEDSSIVDIVCRYAGGGCEDCPKFSPFTKMCINAETEDGSSYEYEFWVSLFREGERDYIGKYEPGGKGLNLPCVRITTGPKTMEAVRHESIHACIDFFRKTQNVSFDDLFNIAVPFGEEAFVHYVEHFYEAVLTAIGQIEI